MTKFSSLETGCPAGIPFSKCREYMKAQKAQKAQGKQTKRRKNTRRRKNTNHKKKKRTLKRNLIPPKGVVIRKKGKLYRSNGRSFKLI
tara:strand:- start:81 stop:344 length:264 start_codon:yes stop_codon:yes gene_type:complete